MPNRRKMAVKPGQTRTIRGPGGNKTRVRNGGNKMDVRITPPRT